LNLERRGATKPDRHFIHASGPMNRGVEIDSAVADGPYSVILDQVTNLGRQDGPPVSSRGGTLGGLAD